MRRLSRVRPLFEIASHSRHVEFRIHLALTTAHTKSWPTPPKVRPAFRMESHVNSIRTERYVKQPFAARCRLDAIAWNRLSEVEPRLLELADEAERIGSIARLSSRRFRIWSTFSAELRYLLGWNGGETPLFRCYDSCYRVLSEAYWGGDWK